MRCLDFNDMSFFVVLAYPLMMCFGFDVSAPKQEEVKRLPGGKIKKKACLKPLWSMYLLYDAECHSFMSFGVIRSDLAFFRRSKRWLLKRLYVTSESVSPLWRAWSFSVSYFCYSLSIIWMSYGQVEFKMESDELGIPVFGCFMVKWGKNGIRKYRFSFHLKHSKKL